MRRFLVRLSILVLAVVGVAVPAAPATAETAPQVYGAWHCSDDARIWGTVRSVTEFDGKNHWLIDRGDGRPSVNLVILSFVHPVKLLHKANDATTVNGIPRGMTPEIVNYFKSRGVRVMLSIGGISYTDAWNQTARRCRRSLRPSSRSVSTSPRAARCCRNASTSSTPCSTPRRPG